MLRREIIPAGSTGTRLASLIMAARPSSSTIDSPFGCIREILIIQHLRRSACVQGRGGNGTCFGYAEQFVPTCSPGRRHLRRLHSRTSRLSLATIQILARLSEHAPRQSSEKQQRNVERFAKKWRSKAARQRAGTEAVISLSAIEGQAVQPGNSENGSGRALPIRAACRLQAARSLQRYGGRARLRLVTLGPCSVVTFWSIPDVA